MEVEEITEGIQDEFIKNSMKQYLKIVGLIKDECAKKGVAFYGYGYFRSNDNIKDDNSKAFVSCNTSIAPFDKRWIDRSLKDDLYISER